MIRAELGLSAWDVLHDALRTITPLTFGQVVVAVSLVVLVASMGLGVRPGPGTVANAVLVGAFTDALLWATDGITLVSLPVRFGLMLLGVWAIALGTALYISANLGAGPRDALMLGIAARTGRSAGAARTAIETGVLVAGIALGGSAGIGTVAFVLLIGPAINLSFRLFGVQPARKEIRRANVVRRAVLVMRRWMGKATSTHDRSEYRPGISAGGPDRRDQ